MTRRLAFAVPGDLATPTGGYGYDRRIIAGLTDLGWQVDVIGLDEGFPRPSAAAREAALRLLASSGGAPAVIDGLAYGAMGGQAGLIAATRPVIALVHHPLSLESGLSAADAADLAASEREALALARRVITTSRSTAALLEADFGVPAGRVSVVQPGNEPVRFADKPCAGPLRLLSVGAITPRKGFDVLIAALAMLRDLDWRLAIVGDTTRDPATVSRLHDDIRRHGLATRVQVAGVVANDALTRRYDDAHLFVLASRHEGYGMAFAEALGHGLPVVGTSVGAIPETVPPDAGVLVPPDDAQALADALRMMIARDDLRDTHAQAARRAAHGRPTWTQAAAAFAAAVEHAL